MPVPNWNAFASVTLLVLVVLIALARLSQTMLTEAPDVGSGREAFEMADATRVERDDRDAVGVAPSDESLSEAETERTEEGSEGRTVSPDDAHDADGRRFDPEETTHPNEESNSAVPATIPETPTTAEHELTTGLLLVNVAVSQGLFGVILVVAAVLAAIPLAALGVGTVTLLQLGVGIGLGVALFAANELGQRVADVFGIEYEEGLRDLLTPDSLRGWVVLLGAVLPIIAGFEELLFRAALVGVFTAGFGISPWFLAVGSTVAFAIGHGAQGPGGILVTGTLGGVLAVAFVLSGSLVVVVVAHYLVNALEFTVHSLGERSS